MIDQFLWIQMAGGYDADYYKLVKSDANNAPRKYLVLTGEPPDWVSLATIGAGMSLREFFAYGAASTAKIAPREAVFLWLLSRLPTTITPSQTAAGQYTVELQQFLVAQRLTLEVSQLLNQYIDWATESYQSDLAQDRRRLTLLQGDLAAFAAAPQAFITDPEIQRTTLGVYVTTATGEIIQGLDLLNAATVSAQLPVLVYVDPNGHTTTKIYDPPMEQTRPAYNDILHGPGDLPQCDAIYFFTNTSPRRLMLSASAPGEIPELTFPVVDTTEEIATVRNIIETHTALKVGEPHTKEIVSLVRLIGPPPSYGYPLTPMTLLGSLLGDGRLNRYLYTDESREPFLNRTRLTIQYRRPFTAEPISPPRLGISLVGQMSIATQPLVIYHPSAPTARYTVTVDNLPYLSLLLTTQTVEYRDAFLPHLVSLFSYWRQRQTELEPFLVQWRGLETTVEAGRASQATGGSSTRGESRRIFSLRRLAGDIFQTGYARSCWHQPDIITPDRVPAWNAERFTIGGETFNRMAVPFPLENPTHWFICTDDAFPFLGFKPNNSANASEFPDVPCCYAHNQYLPNKSLWKYMHGEPITRRAARTSHTMANSSLLDLGRNGVAPPAVARLIASLIPGTDERQIVRLGTVRGLVSAVHALCLATNQPDYLAIYDAPDLPDAVKIDRLEALVTAKRSQIAAAVKPGALKQELYDLTDDQITAEIADPNRYFDPLRLYRALETFFQVRIFSLSWPDQYQEGFWLPRGRWFTAYRQPIDKPIVLLLTHRGSIVDRATPNPQTELIIRAPSQRSFPAELTGPLQQALEACQTLSTLTLGPSVVTHTTQPAFDPVRIWAPQYRIVGQELNSVGKGIGVWLTGEGIPETNPIGLMTPFFAPLNLPRRVVTPSAFTATGMAELLTNMGASDGHSIGVGAGVAGYWFPASGQANQIYIPLTAAPVPTTPVVPIPLPVLASTVETEISRVRQAERAALLLTQLIIYLYLVYAVGTERPVTDPAGLPLFWQEYTKVAPGEYDLTQLPRLLPGPAPGVSDEVRATIQTLKQTTPSLVTGGGNDTARFRLMDTNLNDRLYATLRQWIHEHRGEEIAIPEYLDGYFRHEDDFVHQPDQRVFTSWNAYQGWLSYQYEPHILIKTELNQDDANSANPYLYWVLGTPVTNPRVYIVQNVAEGNYRRAIAVGWRWRQHKINAGYQTPAISTSTPIPAIKIYTFSTNNQLELTAGPTGAEAPTNALEVLMYEPGKYAALLPLYGV